MARAGLQALVWPCSGVLSDSRGYGFERHKGYGTAGLCRCARAAWSATAPSPFIRSGLDSGRGASAACALVTSSKARDGRPRMFTLKPIPEAVDLVGNPPPGLTTKTVALLQQRGAANRRSAPSMTI